MGLGLVFTQDSQPDDKSGVVVDQAHDPGLDVVAAQVDEEGPFDINVPKLVRLAALVARSRRPRYRSAAAAQGAEQLVVFGVPLAGRL